MKGYISNVVYLMRIFIAVSGVLKIKKKHGILLVGALGLCGVFCCLRWALVL